LQIPVENAIKHGLRLKEGKRLLLIQVHYCPVKVDK
jgi:LytS/YehU family sensor histidine kinase